VENLLLGLSYRVQLRCSVRPCALLKELASKNYFFDVHIYVFAGGMGVLFAVLLLLWHHKHYS